MYMYVLVLGVLVLGYLEEGEPLEVCLVLVLLHPGVLQLVLTLMQLPCHVSQGFELPVPLPQLASKAVHHAVQGGALLVAACLVCLEAVDGGLQLVGLSLALFQPAAAQLQLHLPLLRRQVLHTGEGEGQACGQRRAEGKERKTNI